MHDWTVRLLDRSLNVCRSDSESELSYLLLLLYSSETAAPGKATALASYDYG